MTKEYNTPSGLSNPIFRITDYVEFDHSGRALCPVCSPKHRRKSKTLSLYPNDSGAYKCFRGCSPELIREALGVPKQEYRHTSTVSSSSTTRTKSASKTQEPKLYSEQKIIQDYSELMSLKGTALEAVRYLANRLITTDLIKYYKLGLARSKCNDTMLYSISIPLPYKDGYMIKKRVAPWDKSATKLEGYKPWVQYGVINYIYFTHLPSDAPQTWLVEGEWDAMVLGWIARQNKANIAVATFTCGCDSLPPEAELKKLPGQVVIFYDRNDSLINGKRVGEESAKKVARALGDRALIAKVPMPENCTVKGWDVTDAIKEGYTLESFERAALEARPFQKLESNSFAARTRTLKKLYDESEDYIEWVVPDILPPNEAVLLAASPRVGKSLFALALARAIAGGRKFLDRPCPQGKVLYICKEDSDVKVKIRLNMQGWTDEELNNVIIENEFTIDEFPDLSEYVKEVHPSLIIFDTLSRIHTGNIGENSADMSKIIAPIQDLARKENVCCLIVHHTVKGIPENAERTSLFDLARGSSAIRGTCRASMILAKTKEGFRLVVENGFGNDLDLALHLNPSDLIWRLNGNWMPPNVDRSQKDIVLDWFKKHRDGTIKQVHEGTNLPKRNIYQILTRLINDQAITRTGSRYTTRYHLSIQHIQQLNGVLNEQMEFPVRDRPPIQQTTSNPSTSEISRKNVTNRYLPDPFSPDPGEVSNLLNGRSLEAEELNICTDTSIQHHSTNGQFVESNGQKVIKRDQIFCDRHIDNTKNFEIEGEESEANPSNQEHELATKGTLIAVFHQSKGYCHVVSQNGSKLELRRPGERKIFRSHLRFCDSRREFETYCNL